MISTAHAAPPTRRVIPSEYLLPMSSAEAIRARITALKLSPHGERWVTQALYPPGDLTRVAIPTRTHYPTLRIEYRPSAVIAAPSATGNWDLMLYSPPGDSTGLVWARCYSGTATSFEQTTTPAGTGVAAGYLSLSPNIAADTVPVSILARSSSGSTSSVSYDIVPNPIRHQGFRITSKSYTAHMTASDLYNSGSVTTAQYDSTYEPSVGYYMAALRPVIPCLGSVPLTEDEITSSSPYAVVGAAKDGVFVPHRIMGPTFGFRRALPSAGRCLAADLSGNTSQIADVPTSSPVLGVMPRFATPTGTASGSVPWWAASVWGTAARPDDMNFDEVTSGITIFRGLNPNATITVMLHCSLECILEAESPFRTLAGDADEPDMRAINAYYEIAARMPHAYPASYNALGLVLPAIASAMRFIAPHLPKIWEGVKAAAPIVAPILGNLLSGSDKKESRPARARIRSDVARVRRDVQREVVREVAGPARSASRPRQRAKRLLPQSKQRIFAKTKPPRRRQS